MSEISRREALRRLGFGALSLSAPGLFVGCADMRTNGGLQLGGAVETPFDRISPVDRYRAPYVGFGGEKPEHMHSPLASKAKAVEGRKIKGHDECPVAIIGGGMSGLITAYLLRDLKPVILEKEERFGGNSRGEAWENVEYSTGAAYVSQPKAGSALDNLFREAGLYSLCHKRGPGETALLDKKVYSDFWSGQTDPNAAAQIGRLRDFFVSHQGGKHPLPEIPSDDPGNIPVLAQMDRFDFYNYIIHKLGELLHAHTHTMLELFSWANLGASIYELNAALGMNFFCAEFGDVLVPPAGNATFAERFLQHLPENGALRTVRPGAKVLDVSPKGSHVEITYFDRLGDLRLLKAKAVVMACPKFVATKLIDGLEADRAEALKQVEYRSYVVANACLSRSPTRELQHLRLLGNGDMPMTDVKRNQHNHGSASVAFANFGQGRRESTVLTISHPLPFKDGREELLAPGAYERFSAGIRNELLEKILPPLGYRPADITELRLTRWGQSIPFAKPGFYWNETPKALSKPFAERIFFVNQDNWAAPAFETCALEALKWAPRVRAIL